MADFPSNLILAGGGEATPSVVPGTARPVVGSVIIPKNTTLAAGDKLQLFYASGLGDDALARIIGILIDSDALDAGAALIANLQDTKTPATVYIAGSAALRAGGLLTTADCARNTLLAVGYSKPELIHFDIQTGAGASVGGNDVKLSFSFLLSQD